MAFSVAKIIHDIVDWSEAELAALEAHLGVHPNRAPKPDAPAAPEAKVLVADVEIQKVVNGLENKLTAALNDIDSLKGQLESALRQIGTSDEAIATAQGIIADLTAKLSAETASLAGAAEANGQLQQQVADLQTAVDELKTRAAGMPVSAEEAAKIAEQQPGDNAFAGETGATDGQEKPQN